MTCRVSDNLERFVILHSGPLVSYVAVALSVLSVYFVFHFQTFSWNESAFFFFLILLLASLVVLVAPVPSEPCWIALLSSFRSPFLSSPCNSLPCHSACSVK